MFPKDFLVWHYPPASCLRLWQPWKSRQLRTSVVFTVITYLERDHKRVAENRGHWFTLQPTHWFWRGRRFYFCLQFCFLWHWLVLICFRVRLKQFEDFWLINEFFLPWVRDCGLLPGMCADFCSGGIFSKVIQETRWEVSSYRFRCCWLYLVSIGSGDGRRFELLLWLNLRSR